MRRIVLFVLLFLGLAAPAYGEVEASGASGFSLILNATVNLAPKDAYKRFVEVKNWWSPEYAASGAAKNLKLDAKPGGCLCEKLADGGFMRHFQIARADPGSLLVLSNGMGPLNAIGAQGSMQIEFKPQGSGTAVTLRYMAFGYSVNGWGGYAPQADRIWQTQMQRYATYAGGGKL
jgi:hypothetical protein